MKKRMNVLLILVLLLAVAPAMADSVLYNNGPYDDDTDAWEINYGFVVSDTFTLMSQSTVTGFQFNTWMYPGDVLTTAVLSITSNEFGGTTYFDQTLNFTQTECVMNAYGFDACRESASVSGPNLGAGTYWLNLQNASVANGDPVYWDENAARVARRRVAPLRHLKMSWVRFLPNHSLFSATAQAQPELYRNPARFCCSAPEL